MLRSLANLATILAISVAGTAAFAEATGSTDTSAAAMEAMQNSQLTYSDIETLPAPEEIDIVSIETVGSIEGENLQGEIDNRSGDIERLQSAIEANEDLLNAIRSEEPDFSVDSVVATDLKSDGRLVIYVLG